MQHRPIPFADIAAELNRLCQAQRSGVLRIVTDKNHAASFGLVTGRVVNVRYRIKRNRDALPLLQQVEMGQYSFNEEEGVADESAALPPNDEILALFAQQSFPVSAPSPAPNVSPPPPGETVAIPVALSPSEQTVLEAALAEHIGPMASIVCRNTLAKTSSLAEAITVIAGRIPDTDRARQFEQEVRSRLF